ncbi:MAG: hypothetical protein ACXW1U_21050, partial [Methylobacter sp.]
AGFILNHERHEVLKSSVFHSRLSMFLSSQGAHGTPYDGYFPNTKPDCGLSFFTTVPDCA